MQPTDLKYPTLAELKELEAKTHRLRAEALRDMGRALGRFVARLFKGSTMAQAKSA